ncbi:hypothetical protein DB30_07337 [Enhygromyxa salina]|uniref:Sialidase domain-containing protein n=1 Tax=Enhygromyxa salina TaxID=215803 RepID=A0A0C2CWK2_9BACT|nr:sialidase family protein [Enhygromyxa salina]KIG14000.1 hypothetical protein DB30_07337 [Enhygromyxa salina]
MFTVSEGPFAIRETIAGEHLAFPDITRLADGRLLLVYREAGMHAVDTSGQLVKQFGQPDGHGWSEPELLWDEPDIDDRDPSITTLADGTVSLNYFRYQFQPTLNGPLSVYQVFYGESHDDGASFGPPSIIAGQMDYPDAGIGSEGVWEDAGGVPITVRACSSPVVELDGRVVAPLYGGPPWVPGNPDSPRSQVILATSETHGQSWSEAALSLDPAADAWLQEPSILALDDQRLLMHVRVAEGDSPDNAADMRQAVSEDGGLSWSEYVPFDFIGQAPDLARLDSGLLVSAFRWVDDTMTQTAVNFMYSMDEGQSWSEMISIVPPQFSDVGYPSILELDDGRVMFVYYVSGTSIRATIYDVELVELDPG